MGKPTGGLNGRYLYGCVDYKQIALHRMIWIWHHGSIPENRYIDHIDHNRFNNHIENLRIVTNTGNGRNRTMYSGHPSGAFGVRKKSGRWMASIVIGTFDTKEEAVSARKRVEQFLGFHPNHGKGIATPEDVAKAA